MTNDGPRLPPRAPEQWDDETRSILERNTVGGGRVLNIFATIAHHPKLLKRWLVFGAHVLVKSTLSPRERELLILRIGWRCRSPYEWGQHVVIGRQSGLTDDDIARVAEGPDAGGWSEVDAALLRAADELFDECAISDGTWELLSRHYDEQQLLDVIFTVGQYQLVSMALNTLRVERDDGVSGVPFPERP